MFKSESFKNATSSKQERLEKILIDFRSGKLKYHGTNDEDLKRAFDNLQSAPTPKQEKVVCETVRDYLLCQLMQEKDYSLRQMRIFKYYEAYKNSLTKLPNQCEVLIGIVGRAIAEEIRGE